MSLTPHYRFKELRGLFLINGKKMSQQQLADKLGCTQPSIQQWESGKNVPLGDIVQRIEKAFPEINIKWFIGNEGEQPFNYISEKPNLKKTAFDEFSEKQLQEEQEQQQLKRHKELELEQKLIFEQKENEYLRRRVEDLTKDKEFLMNLLTSK